jgi:hypothetical protein
MCEDIDRGLFDPDGFLDSRQMANACTRYGLIEDDLECGQVNVEDTTLTKREAILSHTEPGKKITVSGATGRVLTNLRRVIRWRVKSDVVQGNRMIVNSQ